MFIVTWEGTPPDDRLDWIRTVGEVLDGSAGSFIVRFSKAPDGWRFDVSSRPDLGASSSGVVANTAESVRYNLAYTLRQYGKPLDPNWEPGRD